MISLRAFARDLQRDTTGGPLMEFGILAPVILAMMMGVMQVGIQMQNMNALRGVGAETARYAIVQYQRANRVGASTMEAQAESLAVNMPYMLQQDRLTVAVTSATSGIAGVTEFTLTLTYVAPSFLGFIGVGSPTLTYSRPIYVST